MMAQLGFETFFVAGHDRGGRVAHRMALDHRERVKQLAVLDIVPTRRLYADSTREFCDRAASGGSSSFSLRRCPRR